MPTDPATYPLQLAAILSDRLRTAKQELVTQWLNRITARVAISTKRVFPTHELLNHVPLLIEGIAGYLKRPERDIDAKAPVVAKAMELGALRHAQGFDAYEILKEYEMLGEIIFGFLADTSETVPGDYTRRDFLICWQRLAQAMELIRQATMSHFLRLSDGQVNERENRLRKFNRTVAHELKNKINAISAASTALSQEWVPPSERKEFEEIIAKNSRGLEKTLSNLESLSRTQADSRHCRNVLLPEAANEAVRELADAANAKGVDVRIADSANVELLQPGFEHFQRFGVEVDRERLALRHLVGVGRGEEVVVEADLRLQGVGGGDPVDRPFDLAAVRGVATARREQLFREFYRAHDETVTDAAGTGLGLSIVREAVEAIGGRAWAEFPENQGSVFAFSVPSRRREDVRRAEAGAEAKEPAGG